MGLAYPSEEPVFWIKYGHSIIWNELAAQAMAHKELQRLGSSVRAPAVYYACQMWYPGPKDCKLQYFGYKSYVVMDYIPGKTAREWLQADESPDAKSAVYSQIAFALSELHRIPVPHGSRPAAVNGGKIRHDLFDEQEVPCHYKDVKQLEEHLNLFLTTTKRKHQLENLSSEPMVFCYSDIWLDNFIIDEDQRVAVIDFADVSILPSSFSKYVLAPSRNKIDHDISDLVIVPTTEGVDNTLALLACQAPMVMGGWSTLASSGRRLFGTEAMEVHEDKIWKPLMDAEGRLVMSVPEVIRPEPPETKRKPLLLGSLLVGMWLRLFNPIRRFKLP